MELTKNNSFSFSKVFWSFIYLPNAPIVERGSWIRKLIFSEERNLLRAEYFDEILIDIFAGLTVAMTLIPQALSYSLLSNLPPIYGLYSSVLPPCIYLIFGTSPFLAVGPVSLVALLNGAIMSKHGVVSKDDVALAVNFSAEVSFVTGMILVVLGVLNCGQLIGKIPHTVISGFTCAAAILICINQLKFAFGFPSVPTSTNYNFELISWYLSIENWMSTDSHGKLNINLYSSYIFFSLLIPLMAFSSIKKKLESNPQICKSSTLRKWTILIINLLPLVGILLSAYHIRYITSYYEFLGLDSNNLHDIKRLKIVGELKSGLNIFRFPAFNQNLVTLMPEVFPLAIIAFLESYSVARRVSLEKGDSSSSLIPNQELVALGFANLSGCFASSFPVSGSFSRTFLNVSSGAKSQISGFITLIFTILALIALGDIFYWVPYAGTAAVVMSAVIGIIRLDDFFIAWKSSIYEFTVIFLTFTTALFIDTSFGLVIGILFHIFFMVFKKISISRSH
jgi:SulP family sulfate permease